MMSLQEIEKIAKKKQTSVKNIARDYLQSLFLFGFYQNPEAVDFLFKGGTALHLVYQSPRYSEDLDFSAKAFNCRVFEKLLEQTLAFLEKNGLKPELLESTPTTGGCLAIFESDVAKQKISIKIEVSLREPKRLEGEAVLVRTDFLPPFDILVLEKDKMVKSKIAALLTRKEPRDFYDLYFILRSDLRDSLNLSENERKQILREVNLLDPGEIYQDLKEFLPQSRSLVIKDLPGALERELKEK